MIPNNSMSLFNSSADYALTPYFSGNRHTYYLDDNDQPVYFRPRANTTQLHFKTNSLMYFGNQAPSEYDASLYLRNTDTEGDPILMQRYRTNDEWINNLFNIGAYSEWQKIKASSQPASSGVATMSGWEALNFFGDDFLDLTGETIESPTTGYIYFKKRGVYKITVNVKTTGASVNGDLQAILHTREVSYDSSGAASVGSYTNSGGHDSWTASQNGWISFSTIANIPMDGYIWITYKSTAGCQAEVIIEKLSRESDVNYDNFVAE